MEKLLQLEKNGDVYVDFTQASKGPIKYKREVKGASDMVKAFQDSVSSEKNLSLKFKNLIQFMTSSRKKKSILTKEEQLILCFVLLNELHVYMKIENLLHFVEVVLLKESRKYIFIFI